MVLDNLRNNLLALVFIGIVVAAGAIAVSSFKSTLTANTTEYNITVDSLAGIDNATGFFPTIGTLLGVAALIAVVVGGFIFLRR